MPEGYLIPLAYKSEGNPATQASRTTTLGDERLAYGQYSSQFTPTDGNLSRTTTRSMALNLQSFYLNDLLVANLGWRNDRVELKRAQAPFTTTFPENLPILDPAQFNLRQGDTLSTDKSNFGYGLVLKTPAKWLPAGMSLSVHYGANSNFVAVPGLHDFEGNTVPNQSGSTKDYGITLGVMNDKLVIRLNAYRANITNENYGDTSNAYRQFLNVRSREFGQTFIAIDRYDQNRDGRFDLEPSATTPGGFIDPDLNKNGILDAYEPGGASYVPGAQYMTLGQLGQFYDAYKALWNDWVSGQLQYVFTPKTATSEGTYSSVQFPSNVLSDTVDLLAKGYEIEVTCNPTENLRFAFNATQTTARRSNVAPRMGYLVKRVIEIFEAVPNAARLTAMNRNALEVPLATAAFDDTTILGNSLSNSGQGGGYFIAKALEGSDNPELSKYSFNVLGNYRFSDGRLKGVNLGAAYRWTDKKAIGYPNGLDPSGRFTVGDVSKPYFNVPAGYADFWVGYRRRIFSNKVGWKIQLNIRNVFADSEPVAVQAQPDGSIARVSIPVPRQFVLSNSFTF
jgi:hypothetical protein